MKYILLGLAIFSLLLAGCGSSEPDPAPELIPLNENPPVPPVPPELDDDTDPNVDDHEHEDDVDPDHGHDEEIDDPAPMKVINIEMFDWDFNIDDVTINEGDNVRLVITSKDGVHGVAIPEFGVSTSAIPPGGVEVIDFVADKTGSFDLFCNIPCGAGHSNMRTQFVVE